MTDTTQTPLEHQPLIIVKPEEISKAYELPDVKIAEIATFCEGITIAGPDDKANYKTASQALTKVKKYRTGIEAKRKELKEPFLQAGKDIDAEAKRLTALLAPIEAALGTKIKAIDDIAAKLELERRDHLHKQMITAGYTMEGSVYHIGRKIVAPQTLWDANEEQLNNIILDGLDEKARIEREAAEQLAKDEEIARLKAKIAEGKQAAGVVDEPEKERGINITQVAATEVGKQLADEIEAVLNTDLATPQVDMFSNIPAPTEQPKQEPCTTTVMDFDNGWNACREAVLKMMRSDVKLTRQQWIENVEQLTPTV